VNKDQEYDDVDRLVEALLNGTDEEEAEWEREREREKLAEEEQERERRAALDRALSKDLSLRDRNFVDATTLLVFDEETGSVSEVAVWDLPLRYPVGERWVDSDFGRVLRLKFAGYRQSVVAQEVANEDREAAPWCSTVVLTVPKDSKLPYSYVEVKARLFDG